jgi:hypothetical protein
MNLNAPDRIAAQGKKATAEGPRPARKRASRKGSRPFSANELLQIGTDIAVQWFRPVEASCLTLMEIDPWNVHAYWNIAEADLAAARARLPAQGHDAALLLRFTDISPRLEGAAPHDQFDIEVQQTSNNWYVNLWRDAWHYSAELGLRAADGAFTPLLRSNEVSAPRAGASPELDFHELEVRSPRLSESGPATVGSEVNNLLLRDLFPKRLQPHDDFPLAIAEAEHSGTSLDEPEFPSLNVEAEDAADLADMLQQLAQDAEVPGSGAGFAAREPSGHFPFIAAADIAPYHDLARQTRRQVLAVASSPLPLLPRLSRDCVAPTGVELSPQPLPIPIPPTSERNDVAAGGLADTLLGATDSDTAATADTSPPTVVGAASAGRPPVALEALLADTVFSRVQGDAPALASAHVIIEGQAAPDTSLMLFGKRVQQRADRSFTLKLPLQRGPELAALLHHLRGRYGDWGEG